MFVDVIVARKYAPLEQREEENLAMSERLSKNYYRRPPNTMWPSESDLLEAESEGKQH